MFKKTQIIPIAILTAGALVVPTTAMAGGKHKPEPSITVNENPQCDGLTFTAALGAKKPKGGTYTVTAQVYDSETVTPVGSEQVFTGDVSWGENVAVTIPEADDFLLWTYRVETSKGGKALVTYGERQLDCRTTEEAPEPEEPETPEVPLTPLEPATPIEPEGPAPNPGGVIGPDRPETPDAPGTEPVPTTVPVVTEETTTDAPKPVVANPSFTG